LGAPFFGLAPFFQEAFSGATVAPCSATAAVFSLVAASAFIMVVSGESFLRQIRRTTIHGSGCQETQGESGRLGDEPGRGERLREDFLSGYSPFRKGSYFILEGNLIVLPATIEGAPSEMMNRPREFH
jgi:hypothetical protein